MLVPFVSWPFAARRARIDPAFVFHFFFVRFPRRIASTIHSRRRGRERKKKRDTKIKRSRASIALAPGIRDGIVIDVVAVVDIVVDVDGDVVVVVVG